MSEKRPCEEGGEDDYPAAKRERVDSFGGAGAARPAGNVSVRCLVAAEDAGAVIGKGGSIIKHLRTLASSVLLPDSNGAPDRVLTVTAQSIDLVIEVLKSVLPQFGQSSRTDPTTAASYRPTLRLLLLQDVVGGIIGRGGSRVTELRESTKTSIKILPDPMPGSTERMASISGTDEDILSCVTKILEFVAENPSSLGNPMLFDPAAAYTLTEPQQWGRGGRGGSRGGRGGSRGGRQAFTQPLGGAYGMSGRGGGRGGALGGAPQGRGGFGGGLAALGSAAAWQSTVQPPQSQFPGGVEDATIVTEQVTIPDNLAGAIIGPRGSRVAIARERSNCQIKIEEPKPDRSDRVITINGTRPNVTYAQELLQESVRQFSSYGQ